MFFVNPLCRRIGQQHRSIEGLQIVIWVAVVVSHQPFGEVKAIVSRS